MEKVNSEKSSLKYIPTRSGVYIFKSSSDTPIYVGKAKNLKSRLASYFSSAVSGKTATMVSTSKYIEHIPVRNEFEALLLEANLVKLHRPKYNIELKDDKSPLYIGITDETIPRIITLRQTQLEKFKLKNTFGPYLNAAAPRKVLRLLRKAFPFSSHRPTNRTCVLNEIGLCAPCPSEIKSSNDKDLLKKYKFNIRKIKSILSGKVVQVENNLQREINKLNKLEKFEEAKEVHKQLTNLQFLVREDTSPASYISNPNLLEDIRRKELEELATAIAQHINISKLDRIECFDVAHLSGAFPTASMVTFTKGEPDKNRYRQYKIHQSKSRDDLASMREVFSRRSRRFKDLPAQAGWGKPDLIIVDGGKGQVKAAYTILSKYDVPVVGLAKSFETLVFYNGDSYHEVRLPKGNARNLVSRMRDEAHRFARKYHHNLVSKAIKEA